MERWLDRVAVVTGASEGIGAAIVRRLAAAGLRVVALARREALLKDLEDELTAKKHFVRGRVCDVTNATQLKESFEWIEENVGPVSVLVNNAAVFHYSLLTDIDLGALRSTVDTNFAGLLQVTKFGLASMRKNNITDGHIININSVLGQIDYRMKGIGLYSSTKHALRILSNHMKLELMEEKSKIRVTSISPGLVRTTMSDWYLQSSTDMPALEAEDIAETVVYALSTPPHVNICELTVEHV